MQITKLTFKKTQIRAINETLTFVIENIKMRNKSGIAYFKFYGFDVHGNQIIEYESDKWVISTIYNMKQDSFQVNPSKLDSYVIEMYVGGATSENPLYMNHLMLTDKEYSEYHEPLEARKNVQIGFKRNNYVNLYTEQEEYLQIIRPYGDKFTSETLTPSQTTILVPHLPNESDYDDPTSIVYEYMLMNEQKIRIEK